MAGRRHRRRRAARARTLGLVSFAVLVVAALVAGQAAEAVSSTVVISEFRVRGPAGGNDEFIELYNLSASPVAIGGWKIKGSNNTGGGTTTPRATITAGTTLQPGCHYLLTNAATSGYSGAVPGDQTYVTGITDDGGIAVTQADDSIVDAVGMSVGSAFKEGTPLASLGASNLNRGYERKPGGAAGSTQDTDDNSADFQVVTPSDPQSSASTCTTGGDQPPAVGSTSPANGAGGVAVDAGITITFSEPVDVSGSWFSISCGVSGLHTATATGGPTVFTLDPDTDFAQGESCTVTVVAAQVTDQDTQDPPDTMAADFPFTFQTILPLTAIHAIQGAAHLSPLAGQTVRTSGIVTARSSNGFWVQDPSPDADEATSEGIFVFTASSPTVSVGDSVSVTGRVNEFRPGGATNANLTTTELGSPSVSVLSTGNPLPAATLVGLGGRTPPTDVIEDDATGSVENTGVFDPASDGIDFWESMEGMRVQLNDALAVGPTNAFGETPVVADNGVGSSLHTPRGGLIVRPTDFNPERVVLDNALASVSPVDVGAVFNGPTVGVLDYNFGNFFLETTSPATAFPTTLARETTDPVGTGELSVATFNVENLDPFDPQSKFDTLAGLIVDNLRAPDLLSVEEVQDDNGPTDNGVVDASQTWAKLIAAIQAAGGPTYQFRSIDPVDDQDGGEPGGNIRVGFLFRTDTGLAFVDRPGAGSTTPNAVVSGSGGPELTFSPGRVDPANAAWTTSRKPLAGEFTYGGAKLFVIANHFNSKGGDDPLMGRFQPPTRISEVQRHKQAQVVHDFVGQILGLDPNARVVLLGDLNDFEFSDTVHVLESGGVLSDLIDGLPQNERYSYVFEGNSQDLDHVLVSPSLTGKVSLYDVVHVNAEFATQASDHDPPVAHLCADATPPTLSVSASPATLTPPNHKYVTVTVTRTVADAQDPSPTVALVSATSSEPDDAPGGADGATTNDVVVVNDTTFRVRAERSETGPGRVYTFTYRATDACGNATTSSTTVSVPAR